MSRPAVFFDRDGVVNVSPGDGYVLNWSQFDFAPGAIEALRLCKEKGYATVLVTSQQGVGKRLMSQTDLDHIHSQMQEVLRTENAAFDAIHACTCLATDPGCKCRKPSVEMIFTARDALDLDLAHSWLIGDHDRDIQMAINAGVPNTIRIQTGEHPSQVGANHTLKSTSELPSFLRTLLG
jgi:D-glycero-D-manno-heptose 1,7-bisphosphate phosphatase